MNSNWLKILVAISAIMVAGSAAYFSVTGLGVLFSGAAIAVMIMASSLEFAKLVAATYLKQQWDNIKGLNKWYLTSSVIILMVITSAGIFGYLSNAFQQQNLKLEQVQREIDVWDNKIKSANDQINTLTSQLNNLQSNQGKILDNGKVNNRLLRSVDNRDKQSSKLSDKISVLQDSIVSYNGQINNIKNNNIEIEREVGGFRFVAEAFNIDLKSVVKFFIILIVIVFDPLAVALVISFNQLVMVKRKDEDEKISSKPEDLKDFVDETTRLHLSENDIKILEEHLLKPKKPNENLVNVSKEYEKNIKTETQIQEPPYVSDDFQIGPNGAFEINEETQNELSEKSRDELMDEMVKQNQELGLYDIPTNNNDIVPSEAPQNAKEMLLTTNDDIISSVPSDDEISDWDETLMNGLEKENIFHEEPTIEDQEQNFSTIEPISDNIFHEESTTSGNEYVPVLSDEEILEMNQDEYERKLDMEDDFDGFVPEPFATPEEVVKYDIDNIEVNEVKTNESTSDEEKKKF
jgi:hypothetical protein